MNQRILFHLDLQWYLRGYVHVSRSGGVRVSVTTQEATYEDTQQNIFIIILVIVLATYTYRG